MKPRTIALLSAMLLLAASAYTQSNSCAYTFTYPKQQFSFCITPWGTLASLQSPIGVNHLDPNNPIEGFASNIGDDGGGQDGAIVVPGLDLSYGQPPKVTQPRGPGKLPLIFEYDSNWREVVTATPDARMVHFTVVMRSCFNCYWMGTISRIANIEADGNTTNTFAQSLFAGFGFLQHGVMLSVGQNPSGCAGVTAGGVVASAYWDCPATAPFSGTGGVFTSTAVYSYRGHPTSVKTSYQVF
jgi:hypothetical protein